MVCVLLSFAELTDVVEMFTGALMVGILFSDTEVTDAVGCSVVSVVVVVLFGDPCVVEGSREVELCIGLNSIVVVVGNKVLVIPVLQ